MIVKGAHCIVSLLIPRSELKVVKVLGNMIRVSDIISIFAASWRGKRQRRGATTERSRRDKGKRFRVCNFDHRGVPP